MTRHASPFAVWAAALLLCACKAPRIDDYRPSAGPIEPEALQSPAGEASILLAQVGDDPIVLAEYQRLLNGLSDEEQRRVSSPQARRQLLEAIIAMHLLATEAEAHGLATDPAVALAEASAVRDVVLDREANSRVSLNDVNDDAVGEYHYAHTYRYHRPEQRNLSLLLTTDRDSAEAVVAAVRASRDASVAETLAQFRQLAHERSLLPDLVDLGYVDRTNLASLATDSVVEAAFSLDQPGAVTDPLPVSAGYAVLLLVELRRDIDQPLPAAAELIRDAIVAERRRDARVALRQEARQQAQVEVDDALLARLEAAAPPAPPVPPWVDMDEFLLNHRLTPSRDLTMLGQLLRAPEAPAPGDAPRGDAPQPP